MNEEIINGIIKTCQSAREHASVRSIATSPLISDQSGAFIYQNRALIQPSKH